MDFTAQRVLENQVNRVLSHQAKGSGIGIDRSQLEFSYTAGWKYELAKVLWKTIWWYLVMLTIYIPQDLTIPHADMYLADSVHTCTRKIPIAEVFVGGPTADNPRAMNSRMCK